MTPGRGDLLRRKGHGPGRDRRRALSLRMATGHRGRPAGRDMSRCRCEAKQAPAREAAARPSWTTNSIPRLECSLSTGAVAARATATPTWSGLGAESVLARIIGAFRALRRYGCPASRMKAFGVQ